MNPNHLSRRNFLTRIGVGGVALGTIAVGATAACSKGAGAAEGGATAKCDDTTGLDDAAKALRTSLKYSDAAPDPTKVCEKCLQFVAPEGEAACGGCKLFKGTVSPKGTCAGFAAKPA
ncbi:MAG: hypothetical protein EXR79_16580 [Myxococcales bacterium]|nr:hypothetical protein [Myxococcales bacterium]